MADYSFRVVPPITINADAQLVSTNVPEADFAAWSAATAYAVGDRVIRTTTHAIYQRLVAGTTATVPELDAVNWVYVSPTNRWKAFDTSSTTAVSQAAGISFRVKPGAIHNAVGLVNVVGTSVRLRQIDPVDGTVFDKTYQVKGGITSPDWYSYFFGRVVPSRQIIELGIKTYLNADILVDITPVGGVCSLGAFVVGAQQVIGRGVGYGASLGIIDYSSKSTNPFGDTVLTKRAFAKRGDFTMWLSGAETDDVYYRLADLRATSALYVASTLFEATAILGFYKDFSITLTMPNSNACSIQIEGLA